MHWPFKSQRFSITKHWHWCLHKSLYCFTVLLHTCSPSVEWWRITFIFCLSQVDDVILTYYNTTSILSVLRQPSSGVASSTCIERSPASMVQLNYPLIARMSIKKLDFFFFFFSEFLRSGSLSCSQIVSAQSCRRDSSLSFSSYFTGFSLLKVSVWTKSELSVNLDTKY